jgi:hypothetical protein
VYNSIASVCAMGCSLIFSNQNTKDCDFYRMSCIVSFECLLFSYTPINSLNHFDLLDDQKGGKEAMRLGFQITGTLGILSKVRSTGIIPALKTLMVKQGAAGFRISPQVLEELLLKSGEL